MAELSSEMEELKRELSKYGWVRSIENSHQFSLLMTKTDENLNSSMTFKILDLVKCYVGSEKQTIGTLISDEDLLFLTLKP